MNLRDATKEKLDRFGPYGSAIGAFIGAVIFTFFRYDFAIGWIPIIIFLLLPVLLNTCIHRKFFILSVGAAAAFVGALISCFIFPWIFWLPLTILFTKGAPENGVIISWGYVFISAYIVYLLSKYSCERARKKEKL